MEEPASTRGLTDATYRPACSPVENATAVILEDAAHRGEDVPAAGRAGVACRRRERGRVRQRSTCGEPAREEGRRLISFTHFLIRPLLCRLERASAFQAVPKTKVGKSRTPAKHD